MTTRLHRDLRTLRRVLESCGTWRLPPEHWDRAGRALDELAGHLADGVDERGIDAVLQQFEEIEPTSRAITRIDAPGRVPVPESIHTRIVQLVPVIVDGIERHATDRPRRRGGDAR